MRKKITAFLICAMMSVPQAVQAAEYDISDEKLQELAEEFSVDIDLLRENIESFDVNRDQFSPYEGVGQRKSEENEESPGIIPFAIGYTYKSNQDTTAYVASSTAITSTGVTPQVGMCAVKHTNGIPYIPYGTKLFLNTGSVTIQGNTYSSFVVQDCGSGSGRTDYWFDIFFGVNNTANYHAAIQYGVIQRSYRYETP
ncbi:MAG: hypothetical protein LBQ15_04475 [Clostridium sp.]|jgi:hypothetical protein|nr:hypothetical protein [Clostridium sp.]